MFRDEKKGKDDFTTVGRGHWEYSDAAARAAAFLPTGSADAETPEETAAGKFSEALTTVTWKGLRGGWPEDFRFAKDGQVITTNRQTMPQRWVLVQPGHVITVNNRIIDSLTIDLEAGTLQSNAFSEDTPKASWTTNRIVAAP